MSRARIILASGSPRRRELLHAMGVLDFVVEAARVDESALPRRAPRAFALAAAYAKAAEVAERLAATPAEDDRPRIVLAADTVVALDGEVYGKPTDDADARRMLGVLSGRAHEVITGFALARVGSPETRVDASRTVVHFRALTTEEIAAYVATGEPSDKAGAYGIQGDGGALVDRIEGDYYNVVGLPCGAVVAALRDFEESVGALKVPAVPRLRFTTET